MAYEQPRLFGGRERLLLQGVEGQLLSREDQAGGHAGAFTPSGCRRSRSTTPSTACPRPRCWRTGRARRPRTSASRSRRRGASRTWRASRRTRPPTPSPTSTSNLAALGAKRGPVLFQLPPFLKKDLPRLTAFLGLLPEGTARRSSSATRAGSTTTCTPRSRAPARRSAFRARRQRAAAAGGDRALGLRAAAARELLGRRSGAVGGAARGHRLARNLRVLHARADGAGLCADADASSDRA